jgi:hypothetical protein
MEIRTKTGQVMYESEYRAYLLANSGPSFGVLTSEIMVELEIEPVLEGAQATTTAPYQISQRDGVEKIGGYWYTKYTIGPVFVGNEEATAAEQEAAYKLQKDTEQAASVRQSRNDKLKDCDWTQLVDSTADKALWATYRQALRDVSGQVGFPWDITWPEQL